MDYHRIISVGVLEGGDVEDARNPSELRESFFFNNAIHAILKYKNIKCKRFDIFALVVYY